MTDLFLMLLLAQAYGWCKPLEGGSRVLSKMGEYVLRPLAGSEAPRRRAVLFECDYIPHG